MRIGIDLDNTLNNLNSGWLLVNNLKYGELLTIEDIKCWDIHRYTKRGRKIYDLLQPWLFEGLVPLPYSQEVTKRLSKRHELFVVTATEPNNMEVKTDWLKKHFPHVRQSNIIVAKRKDLINVDVLIDDAPHNIVDFPGETIVLDYAWNRELDDKYPRAYDWYDIERLLQDIEQKLELNYL